jgi:steroid delta-isomerase-like uncharacterized protein
VIQALTDVEQRNLRTVEAVHPAWNRGDVEGVLAHYDDAIRWRNIALEEVYEGKDAVGEFLLRLFTAIPDLSFTAHSTIARGDNVAEQWTIRGTHLGTFMGVPPTGRTLEIVGMSMLTFRDAKFVRDEFYFDTGAVMRQMGLMPALAVTRGTAGRAVLWLAVKSLNVLTRGGRRARGARRAAQS